MRLKVFERPFQFMLYPGDHQRIKEIAEHNEIDMADVVREALKQYFQCKENDQLVTRGNK